MAYEIFARKYRPETFAEVVGQKAIVDALQNSVLGARIAPVYIFAGSHGVGKTSIARILAKALNCPAPRDDPKAPPPCGQCTVCKSIAAGEAIDVVEVDAASNSGVDDARQLREVVGYRPAAYPWKVYILDEFHQLSKAAFDALLKTFEEAPDHVCFILCTTELHKVPTTIRSRAQIFDFKRATLPQVTNKLRQIAQAEVIAISDAALELIARRARGSLRDSQKLFDQIVALSTGGEELTAERLGELLGFSGSARILATVAAIGRGDAAALLESIRLVYESGANPQVFASDILEAFRGMLTLTLCGEESPLLDELLFDVRETKPTALALGKDALLAGMQILAETTERMRRAREERVVLELALVRLSELKEMRSLGDLVARLERIEQALSGGDGPPAPAPPRSPTPVAPSAPPRESPKAPRNSFGPPSGADPAPRAPPPRGPSAPANSAQPAVADGAAPSIQLSDEAAIAKLRERWGKIAEGLPLDLKSSFERGQITEARHQQGRLELRLSCVVGDFFRPSFEREEHRKLMEDRLAAALGSPVQLSLQISSESVLERRGKAAEVAPIVEYAQKAFHSRLISSGDG